MNYRLKLEKSLIGGRSEGEITADAQFLKAALAAGSFVLSLEQGSKIPVKLESIDGHHGKLSIAGPIPADFWNVWWLHGEEDYWPDESG